MILGIGTDIIEVSRVAEKIGKEAGFRELVFSPQEIQYCEATTHKYQHYAARFAAKEAFFKALGTGWLKGTAFNEIQITHTPMGQPQLAFLHQTAVTIAALSLGPISVSLSHVLAMATATVIIETP